MKNSINPFPFFLLFSLFYLGSCTLEDVPYRTDHLPGEDQPVLGTVADPVFTPEEGTFDQSISIAISTSTPESTIYYTIDGASPDASATRYSAPISFSEDAAP